MDEDWVIELLHGAEPADVKRLARFLGVDDTGSHLDTIIDIEDKLTEDDKNERSNYNDEYDGAGYVRHL